MLALISTILGFLTSVVPPIVGYFDQKQRNNYELEKIKLQIQAMDKGMDLAKLNEASQAVVQEGTNLRYHDSIITDNEYINILRASVRPLVTYLFFFLFIGVKTAAATLMFQKGYDAFQVLEVIWDEYTVSIFGAVVGFWFGTRSMVYVAENVKKGNLDSTVKPDKKE